MAELCELLEVARSGYYAWLKRKESRREEQNRMLTGQIEEVFEESRGTYGSPRVTAALRHKGYRWNRKRVERVMREKGLRARPRRRWRPKTTDSNHCHPIAPNRLLEHEAPAAVDQVWVGDMVVLGGVTPRLLSETRPGATRVQTAGIIERNLTYASNSSYR